MAALVLPASGNPDMREWAPHEWYHVFLVARRASPTLSAADAALLAAAMEALRVVLPCDKCREHFVAFWARRPFTAELHAVSPDAALAWAQAYKADVDAVAAAAKANGPAAPATAPAPSPALAAAAASSVLPRLAPAAAGTRVAHPGGWVPGTAVWRMRR